MTYRNRKLLDLAHRITICQNCSAQIETGMEPAHSNQQQHGKGVGTKASDCFFAGLCHTCHAWLDSGTGMDPTGRYTDSREDKQAMWRAAFDKTLLILWTREWLIPR